jgi:hypothetical protein
MEVSSSPVHRLFAVLALGLAAGAAHGEILDDVDVRPEGADAVVRVHFAARVQYLRHAPQDGGSKLVQIYFLLASNQGQETAVEERRRLRGQGSLPNIVVTYPVQLLETTKQLKVEFSSAVRFRVRPGKDNRDIEILIVGAGKDAVAARGERVEPQYAILLQTFPTGDMSRAAQVPSQLQNYSEFTSQSVRNGITTYELNLGYFASAAQADLVRRQLLGRFPQAEVIDLAQRRQETVRAVAQATAPPPRAPAGVPVPVPSVAVPTLAAPNTDVDKRAADLMTRAKAALAAAQGTAATDLFNELLILPPNRYSQEAQELVGVAREQAGEFAKAKAEYELYLKLFPTGAGATRVRERLAKLEQMLAANPAAERTGTARAPSTSFFGGFSQYYYGGRSKIQTAFNTPTAPGSETISTVDLNSLVTNVDLNARYRSSESDSRIVFRDMYTADYRPGEDGFNRLNAAYYEYRGLQNGVAARLGRQTGLTGGVPARFDGAVGGIRLGQNWHLNAVAGAPVEYPQLDADRRFIGTNLDFENLGEHWSGNLFAINQTVDNILDRRAVGSELRYLQGASSFFGLVDYDTSYKTTNIFMLQGTYVTKGGTVINALYDRRRAPTLTTTNALIGQPTTSIKTLLETVSEDAIRQQAEAITSTATQALLGFTTPISAKWQAGLDVRLTNIGALPATTINNIDIPAQPATGNIWTYALQAIGSKLYSAADINVFNITILHSPLFRGQQFMYSNVSLLGSWRVEPSIRYYHQEDTMEVDLKRITPGLRLSYQIRRALAIESEYTFERSHTTSPTTDERADRHFWYFGYRVDF